MSIFKKIGAGLKKATKAVGKGIGNAAKFTAKNPFKVLLPVLGVAGAVATGGALLPGLATKLGASKLGGTLFGKMLGKTMKTGTIVREKIKKTLKKEGKPATAKDVLAIEEALQEQAIQQRGFKLPVDTQSQTGTEAREKLKMIEQQLITENEAGNPSINLGALGGLIGLNTEKAAEKAKGVFSFLQGDEGQENPEELNRGVEFIQAKQNQSSILPEGLTKIVKTPIFIFGAVAAAVYFLFINKKTKIGG